MSFGAIASRADSLPVSRAPHAASEARSRARRSRLAAGALVALAAAFGGALVVLTADSGKALALLLAGAVGGAAFLWFPCDAVTLLLGAYTFTAPIAISKALATGAGVYAPALEITLSDVFLFGLFAIWLLRRVTGAPAPRRPKDRLVPWVVAFFAWAWVSALHAEVLSHGVLAALNLSKYLVVYLLVSELVDSLPRLRAVLVAAALGFALQLGVAFLQVATRSRIVLPGMKTSGEERLGYVLSYDASGVTAWRPAGLIQHPNFFADYLVVLLPMLLVLTLLGSRRVGRNVHRIALALFVAGSLALALTLSRGGWIGFVVASVAVLFLMHRRRLISRRLVIRVLALALFGAAATAIAYPPVVLRLLKSDERSTESRLLMMEQAIGIVRAHPVIGVGLATYTRVAKRTPPPDFARYGRAFRVALASGVVHNGYLALWAERGTIGLAITLSVYGVFLRAAMRARRWDEPLLAAATIGLAASLVGQLALYNFDHFYLDSRPGVLWLLFGLLAATLRLRPRPRRRGRRAVSPWRLAAPRAVAGEAAS